MSRRIVMGGSQTLQQLMKILIDLGSFYYLRVVWYIKMGKGKENQESE